MTPYIIFSAAEARLWGWTPQPEDQYYNSNFGTWDPVLSEGSSSMFEVEPVNRRPAGAMLGTSPEAEQLAANRGLWGEVKSLQAQVEQLRAMATPIWKPV